MRDPARMEPLIKMLLEYWQQEGNTDLRLGQLLINLVRDSAHPSTSDAGPQLFNLEDEALFELLDELLDAEPLVSKITAGTLSATKITAATIRSSPPGTPPTSVTHPMHFMPVAPPPDPVALAAARARSTAKRAWRSRSK